jgi:hypothetical protein
MYIEINSNKRKANKNKTTDTNKQTSVNLEIVILYVVYICSDSKEKSNSNQNNITSQVHNLNIYISNIYQSIKSLNQFYFLFHYYTFCCPHVWNEQSNMNNADIKQNNLDESDHACTIEWTCKNCKKNLTNNISMKNKQI